MDINSNHDFKFKIVIDNKICAYFSETNLGYDPREIVCRACPQSDSLTHMPGLSKFEPVTFKWVFSKDSDFYNWVFDIRKGIIIRKTMTIQLMDEGEVILKEWELFNAFPTAFTQGIFDSDNNEVQFESLNLAYESLTTRDSSTDV